MNLNEMPGWFGKAVFGVAAVALLGLGGWVMTGANETTPKPAPTASPKDGYVVPPVEVGVVPPANPAEPAPAEPTKAAPAPAPNPLGNLAMPVSARDLTKSATLAVKVTSGMNTFRWDQNPTAWAEKLRVMVSGDAVNSVTQTVPSGPVLNEYLAQKMSASATASIAKVRLVATGQAMFDVAVTQVSTGTKGKRTTKVNYWVSVDTIKSRVTSIQPSGTGNLG